MPVAIRNCNDVPYDVYSADDGERLDTLEPGALAQYDELSSVRLRQGGGEVLGPFKFPCQTMTISKVGAVVAGLSCEATEASSNASSDGLREPDDGAAPAPARAGAKKPSHGNTAPAHDYAPDHRVGRRRNATKWWLTVAAASFVTLVLIALVLGLRSWPVFHRNRRHRRWNRSHAGARLGRRQLRGRPRMRRRVVGAVAADVGNARRSKLFRRSQAV